MGELQIINCNPSLMGIYFEGDDNHMYFLITGRWTCTWGGGGLVYSIA